MPKPLTALLIGAFALSQLLGASPARAATTTWVDPGGDDMTVGHGTWDIERMTLDFDGSRLQVSFALAALGDPPPFGTGQFFLLDFRHLGVRHSIVLIEDRVDGETFSFRRETSSGGISSVPCSSCVAYVDSKNSQVVMEIG